MKKPQSKKFDYQFKNDQNFTLKDEVLRTTDINILLNRSNKFVIKKTYLKILLYTFPLFLFSNCGKEGCTDPIAHNFDQVF